MKIEWDWDWENDDIAWANDPPTGPPVGAQVEDGEVFVWGKPMNDECGYKPGKQYWIGRFPIPDDVADIEEFKQTCIDVTMLRYKQKVGER